MSSYNNVILFGSGSIMKEEIRKKQHKLKIVKYVILLFSICLITACGSNPDYVEVDYKFGKSVKVTDSTATAEDIKDGLTLYAHYPDGKMKKISAKKVEVTKNGHSYTAEYKGLTTPIRIELVREQMFIFIAVLSSASVICIIVYVYARRKEKEYKRLSKE